MTVQIIQQAIDNQNWDELIKTEFFNLFNLNYDKSLTNQISFNNELFSKFIFNIKYFSEHIKYINEYITNIIYFDEIFKNIFRKIKQDKINLSEYDWKKFVGCFIDFEENYINVYRCREVDILEALRFDNKNSGYLKLLANDDKLYAEIKKYLSNITIMIQIEHGIFDDLSDDEKEKLKDRLIFSKHIKIRTTSANVGEFLKIYTLEEIENLASKDKFFIGKDFGNFIIDYSGDEFFNFIKDRIKKNKSIIYYKSYLKKHPEVLMPDWFSDYLFTPENNVLSQKQNEKKLFIIEAINNMTLEQIDKNHQHIPSSVLFDKDDINVSKITEYKGTRNKDYSYKTRFCTEEEIAENPHFFDPKGILHYSGYYISEETWNILNKTWKKRVKYNNKLTDFIQICNSIHNGAFNPKNIKYLKNKCNVKNSLIIKVIINKQKIENKKLLKMQKFFKLYK